MKVLAIGATGFIGCRAVRRLVEHGHDVAVFHRGATRAVLPAGVQRMLGDRDRLRESQAQLERFAPDVVLDAILYSEAQAREMVDVFRGRTGRVVVLSSADVYRNYDGFRGRGSAPPDPVPLAEDAPLRETRYPYQGSRTSFAYARDYEKILVEQTVLGEPDLPASVLRLPAVYGPGDRQHRLRAYMERMTAGRRIVLQAEQASWRWTRGFVEDVAAAIALAVEDPRSARRVFNVGEESARTEREWVERIGAAAGWTGAVVAVPANELPEHLRQPFDWRYHLWTSTARIRDELGYIEPMAWQEGLERTVAWEVAGPDGPTD